MARDLHDVSENIHILLLSQVTFIYIALFLQYKLFQSSFRETGK